MCSTSENSPVSAAMVIERRGRDPMIRTVEKTPGKRRGGSAVQVINIEPEIDNSRTEAA